MYKRTKNILMSIVTVALLAGTILMSTGIFTQAQSRDFSTTDTYESTGGVFSYEYIFEHYNAFTFEDLLIGVDHINGPIIAGKDAMRLQPGDKFIEKIGTNQFKYNFSKREAQLGVMDTHSGYYLKEAKPRFVGGKALIGNGGQETYIDSYFGTIYKLTYSGGWYYVNKEGSSKPVSYNTGHSFLTDSFINFNDAFNKLYHESSKMLEDGKENYIDIGNGYDSSKGFVEVYEGQTVTISENVLNDPNFKYVVFISENGEKNTGPLDSKKTIINYEGNGVYEHRETKWADADNPSSHININTIGWFPGYPTEGMSKNAMNINLVHNYPDAKEIVSIGGDNGERFGHMLAPNGDVFAAGGDTNGGTISKNFIADSEAHMWPMKAPVEGYKTSFTVNKLWEGVTDDQKINVSVQLYQNGFEYGEPVTLSNPDYTYTWGNLEAMDADGNPYIYTVDELTVLDGFTKTVDGGTITNTFKIKTIDITGTKVWIDGPDVKPVVTLQLLQDGVAYGDPIVLDGTNTYTWTDLPETIQKVIHIRIL